MRKVKNFFKNFYNIYLVFLGVLVTLPILAPIFLHLNLEGLAKVIYFIYSFLCHQFDTRSVNLYDYQFAWCARDTAIWFAVFITALFVKFNKLPKLRWYWVVPFVIPMALDGGLQTIFTFLNLTPEGILAGESLYISNNLSRFMTGAILGIGVGWWLSQQLRNLVPIGKNEELGMRNEESGVRSQVPGDRKQEMEVGKSNEQLAMSNENSAIHLTSNILPLTSKFKHLAWSLTLILVMFLIYFLLVQIWNLSSVQNKPLNSLDSAVRSSGDLFFLRRANAICPNDNPRDLFKFDCFFGN